MIILSDCNCDIAGSVDPRYCETSGQCQCKDSFGGKNCDQCTSKDREFPLCDQLGKLVPSKSDKKVFAKKGKKVLQL